MISSTIICLLPLVALTLAHPFYPCNCGLGPGEDPCRHSTSLVVRPVDIPKPVLPKPKTVCAPVGGVPPLVPIKNPCDCYTTLVKPAVAPKPPCLSCSGAIDLSHHQQLTLSQKQQLLFGGVGAPAAVGTDYLHAARPVLVDDVDGTPRNPADQVPADPVSLHVAYKLAQEDCNRNEDRLAFGFRSMPKEVPLYIKRSNNIPEENLFRLNGQIVELKRKDCTKPKKSLDDEAVEQLIQLAAEEEDAKYERDGLVKTVSLGEIGYGPAKIKEPVFVNIPAGLVGADDGLSAPVKNCADGFVPGDVIITQVPKKERVSLPPVLPEPCPEEQDPFIPPPPAMPPCAVFNSPYTYLGSTSSSSSSASNSYKKSVFLQKLGCD